MSIYIYNNQQAQGPYDENAVIAWLRAGQLSPDAPACRQGGNEWQPLRNLFPGAPQPVVFAGAQPSGYSLAAGNQAVVMWARQNLPARFEIKHKYMARPWDATALDSEGVEMCRGERHSWQNFLYVGYREERQLSINLIRTLVRAVLYRGSERVTVKLAFQTGDALIPGFIHNQKELLQLLETIPAPRQKF